MESTIKVCKIDNCGRFMRMPITQSCHVHYKQFKRNGHFGKKNKLASNTRFYNIWAKIKQRCLDKNATNYERYGGRGITICKEWLIFNNFYNAMYELYILSGGDEARMTIERINNDMGYSSENCTWVTYKEQAQNRRWNPLWAPQ